MTLVTASRILVRIAVTPMLKIVLKNEVFLDVAAIQVFLIVNIATEVNEAIFIVQFKLDDSLI